MRLAPRLGRAALVGAALLPLQVTLGCSQAALDPDAEAPPRKAVSYADIADVIYRLGATDEGLLTLLNAPAKRDAPARPVVTQPSNHAVIEGPTTFTLGVGPAATREPPHPTARKSRWAERFEWLVLERTAAAHGAPMNGDGFLFAFSTAENPELLRVFTPEEHYVTTEDEWWTLATATSEVTLLVTRGVYDEGRLTSDGGPFVGAPLYLAISP